MSVDPSEGRNDPNSSILLITCDFKHLLFSHVLCRCRQVEMREGPLAIEAFVSRIRRDRVGRACASLRFHMCGVLLTPSP